MSTPHQRQQKPGEGEVAEVVRAELQLKALPRALLRDCHHAGVVHEHVELIEPLGHPLGTGLHIVEIGQVEWHNLRCGVLRNALDRRQGHRGLLGVAATHQDTSTARRQRFGCT